MNIASSQARSANRNSLTSQFLAVVIVASGGSILLSTRPHSWAPAVWAAGSMLVYLLISWRMHREELTTESFADNYYYLGFLLTLVALVTVLIRLSTLEEDEILRTVLSQFGLALVTTLVGLAGRTVLMMLRVDREDSTARLQATFEAAYDDLTRALRRVSTVAETFSGDFQARLEASLETIDESMRRFKTIMDQASNQLSPARDRLVQLTDSLEDALGEVRGSTQSLADGLSASSEQVLASISNMSQQADEAARRIGSLGDSSAQLVVGIRIQFERTFRELQSSVSAFDNELREIGSSLEELPGRINDVGSKSEERMGEVQTSIRTFVRELQDLNARLGDVTHSLTTEGMEIQKTLALWRGYADDLTKLQAELVSESADTAGAVRQVRDEVAAGVEFLVDRLGRTSEG